MQQVRRRLWIRVSFTTDKHNILIKPLTTLL